ncbi:MAG: hypothetical protein A2Y77_08480 [Planctomycetes bacterium RBG_13_62_9]|nr:MAG: hypothetical protein A2Y77_08480 [Planctomycetes bacterium RBG_13_62_9]
MQDWQASVESAIELEIQHVSAYSLSFEPGAVFDAWRRAGRLAPVDEELDRAMYEWAIERLCEAGLEQYEISSFAVAGRQCLHNLGYWLNRPFVGVGPGAASSTGILPVIQDSWAGRPRYGQRITNAPDLERYVAAVESGRQVPNEVHLVEGDDAICETAVLNLRMRAGIDLAEFRRKTGCDALKLFAEPIRWYGEMGMIEATDQSLRLTPQALPVADTILCDFSALD